VRVDLTEVFKIDGGLLSIKLEIFFELDNKGTTKEHQWKLKKKRCDKTLIYVNTFSRRLRG